jgi:long-subunit acyl-CoA synthetase (AMP-forming)
LVAIIVINTGIVIHWAKSKGLDTSNLDKLCTSNELFEQIMFEVVKYATVEKLLPYEIPRNYHLTTEKFTIENKRMTSSEKICRPQLETDFKQLLQDLYKTAESATEDKLVLNEANMKRLMNNFTQETVDKVLTDALNLPSTFSLT